MRIQGVTSSPDPELVLGISSVDVPSPTSKSSKFNFLRFCETALLNCSKKRSEQKSLVKIKTIHFQN